ncbi:MAG: ABC transporter ATP-binding protein/permease [Patescibacteria group bacterium]|nr:ABC transporter ATP-binding protein/permease [Patescibacteria group bacterium]
MDKFQIKNKYDLIKKIFLKFRFLIISIFLIQTAISVIGAAIPYLVKLQLDYLQNTTDFFESSNKSPTILFVLLIIPFFLETIRRFVFEKTNEKLWHKASYKFANYISENIWNKLNELDWGFFANKKNDRIVTNVTLSATNFGRDCVYFFTDRVYDIASIATIIPIIGLIDYKILIFCLIFGSAQALIANVANKHEVLFAIKQEITRDEKWKIESLLRYDFPQLKILGVTKKYLDQYKEKNKQAYELDQNQAISRFMFQSYILLTKNALTVIVSIIIGIQVLQGTISIGTYTLITAYAMQIASIFLNIMQSLRDWHDIDMQFDRINFVLMLNSRIIVNKNPKRTLLQVNKIELKKVSFTYPDLGEEERLYIAKMIQKTKDVLNKFSIGNYKWEIKDWEEALKKREEKRQVLSSVSLKIEKGKIVALLGRNGSGKTTITHLLLHGLEADSGEICIDDINIRDISIETLLSLFSIIQQEPFFLWRHSIRENLTVGSNEKNISDKKQWQALETVGIADTIRKLPDKLDTIIGENYSLSGGEQQLIVLARIFLQQRPFIIFDEGTNQLDVEHEAKIFNQLRKLKEKSGILFITHRITNARKADYIYMLDDGRIVEEGKHEELLKIKNGLYRKFWDLQVIE